MEQIEIVVAHGEGATLRVGDTTLKIDTDQERIDVEVAAMVMAPVPTPEILWRRRPGRRLLTGILDWSEAPQGDGLYDLAALTLAHEEHLEDVIAGTAPTSTST